MEEVNQTPQSINNETPAIKTNNVKPNNGFLVSLLSVLLLISVLIAGFFAYQTQNLVKEITKLRVDHTPITTVEPLPTSKPVSYHGYDAEGKRFSLNLGNECTEEIKSFDNVNIICNKTDFVMTINPQAGGSGANSTPTISKLKFGNFEWEKRLFIDKDGEYATYGMEYGKDYYLIQVIYDPYSIESSKYFDQILSTFKFVEPVVSNSPVACTEEAKICPDGSAVGRSGSKCEFAPCPTSTSN